ncbi:MAG TPA: hypothetical protein VMV05_03000, partial [bacterium]|nr:hypothetical protein [bacterium]
ARLKSMGAWFAFGLGFFITLTSFPVSFPYFAVLSRYSALHLGLGSVLAYVLVYNVGYASPMVLILLIYLRLKQGTDGIHDLLHQKALLLNAHLTTWTFIAFGAFSMMDAVCFFAFGRVLIKGRFF